MVLWYNNTRYDTGVQTAQKTKDVATLARLRRKRVSPLPACSTPHMKKAKLMLESPTAHDSTYSPGSSILETSSEEM